MRPHNLSVFAGLFLFLARPYGIEALQARDLPAPTPTPASSQQTDDHSMALFAGLGIGLIVTNIYANLVSNRAAEKVVADATRFEEFLSLMERYGAPMRGKKILILRSMPRWLKKRSESGSATLKSLLDRAGVESHFVDVANATDLRSAMGDSGKQYDHAVFLMEGSPGVLHFADGSQLKHDSPTLQEAPLSRHALKPGATVSLLSCNVGDSVDSEKLLNNIRAVFLPGTATLIASNRPVASDIKNQDEMVRLFRRPLGVPRWIPPMGLAASLAAILFPNPSHSERFSLLDCQEGFRRISPVMRQRD